MQRYLKITLTLGSNAPLCGMQAGLSERSLTLHALPGTAGKHGQASEQAPAWVQFALVSKILPVLLK